MKIPSSAAQLLLVLHTHPAFNRRDIDYFVEVLGPDPLTWAAQLRSCKRINPPQKHLLQPLLVEDASQLLTVYPPLQQLLEQLHDKGVGLLCPSDEDYPQSLRRLRDIPSLLFFRGDATLLSLPQIAMVGSRQASLPGQRASREFAYQFARGGFVVTSGLARGIDAAAHRGCMDGGGKTIAVLACGLDDVYPKRHRGLATDILASGGTILSEYPLGIPALPHQFPIRNRLITGLSQALLVVEAARHSGSVVSAKWAAEQGIDVFALPGSIYSPQSEGCLDLLKQGAMLATAPSDVVAGVQFELFEPSASPPLLSTQAKTVLALLGSDPVGVDSIAQQTQWPVARVMACLAECEVAGAAQMVANRYIRR